MDVIAKFIGTNGSMGYRKNSYYRISIVGNIVKSQDHKNCPYESIESFFNNWDMPVHVEKTK